MFDEGPQQPRSRAEQKRATGRAVLEAARAEFERVGYEAANLRSIARAAGVSAGTVVHHFGDKRELLHAAFFDDLQVTLERALARPATGTLPAQLTAIARSMFRYYTKRPTLSRTLLREALFAEPPWAERFNGQVGRVHAHVASLAQAAIARGEVSPTLDTQVLATSFLSFFYFALLGWVQGAQDKPTAMVAALLSQHLEDKLEGARG